MTRERAQPSKRRFGSTLIYHLTAQLVRPLFRFYGCWKVIGLENVPSIGPVLLPCNHASYLDPLLVGAALYGRRRPWALAKDTLWRNPVLAYVIDCLRASPIRRNTADRAALQRILDWLAQGEAVMLFPEGIRTRDGLLNPAQPGIALLAQKSGAPVVPVALMGTYEMWPENRKSFKRAPLTVVFGAPVTFTREATREEVATAVMRAIADLMTAHGQPTSPPTRDRTALLSPEDA